MTGLGIQTLDRKVSERRGLLPGDRVLKLCGRLLEDELDYHFLLPEGWVTLDVSRPDEVSPRVVRITESEARRICFEPMQPRRCRNRCVFCFVDQMPPGLRRTLYVKDEDYRLSFLHGNYVTLSSLSDRELARILSMRFSPLYVSVHATDPVVRNRLLGRARSRDIGDTLGALARGGVTLHTQLVLCPGINDGAVLTRTVSDLAALHPAVASIAVVPVGVTRFRKRREGEVLIRRFSGNESKNIVNEVNILREKLKLVYGKAFLYLADEFYLKAGCAFPSWRQYHGFPQWENGVGMLPLFLHEWQQRRRRVSTRTPANFPCIVAVTGELAYAHLLPYIRDLKDRQGVGVELVPVRNRFFGRQVTVAGLLVGRDVRNALKDRVQKGSVLLVPEVMLNREKRCFLDDVTLEEIGTSLGVQVSSFRPDPAGFEKVLQGFAGHGKRIK